jgi:hypothetical protein
MPIARSYDRPAHLLAYGDRPPQCRRAGACGVQHRRQGPVNLTNRYVVRSMPPSSPTSHQAVDEVDAAPAVGLHGGAHWRRPPRAPEGWPQRFLARRSHPSPSPSRHRRLQVTNGGGRASPAPRRRRRRPGRRRLPCRRPQATWPRNGRLDHANGLPGSAPVGRRARLVSRGRRARHPGAGGRSENQGRGAAPVRGAVLGGGRARSLAVPQSLQQRGARLPGGPPGKSDGQRVRVQRLARQKLTAEATLVTRLNVARRACALLRRLSNASSSRKDCRRRTSDEPVQSPSQPWCRASSGAEGRASPHSGGAAVDGARVALPGRHHHRGGFEEAAREPIDRAPPSRRPNCIRAPLPSH